jgi:hypothetical protein
VVPRYDCCLGAGLANTPEKPEYRSFGRGRWPSIVEYVARHQEEIDTFSLDEICEIFQHGLKLGEPVNRLP